MLKRTDQSLENRSNGAKDAFTGIRVDGLELTSKIIGPLPIINPVLEQMGLLALYKDFVISRGNHKLGHADTLMILTRSIMIQREPVYELAEWSRHHDPQLLGLGGRDPKILSDDRFARALDQLFLADRATMLTKLVLTVIDKFAVDVSQLHNDSTSVTGTGKYDVFSGLGSKRSTQLKRGHNKDHRPDLKQLVFTMTVSRDGAVPVHFKAYDGNVTDDKTHIETWNFLCLIVGGPDFTYVADCKLCTKEQMAHIHFRGGKFITIMPRSRSEDKAFREFLRSGQRPDWQELLRRPNPENAAEEHIYYGFESPSLSAEGHRIIWVLSTQKRDFEAQTRKRKIDETIADLAKLKARIGSARLRSKEEITAAVTKAFEENGSVRWFDWQLVSKETDAFKQIGKGRPGKETKYEKTTKVEWTFTAMPAYQRIADDAIDDGIFPLITNHMVQEMTAREVLEKYKYQPFLEKRHEKLKSVLEIAPMFFKRPHRIEALMFVYFVSLMASSLIEREIQIQMKKRQVTSLRLYPEARPCKHPTAERIFTVFGSQRRHTLTLDTMEVKTFHDPLSALHHQVLDLLGTSPAAYTG